MRILLIIVIIIGIGVVIGSILIGSMTFEGTVTDHPYEKGLRWDETMGLLQAIHINIKNNRFYTGENLLYFTLSTDREDINAASMRITLTRPGTGAYDQTFIPEGFGDKQFIARLTIPAYGYWDLMFRLTYDHREIVIPKRIYVEKKGQR